MATLKREFLKMTCFVLALFAMGQLLALFRDAHAVETTSPYGLLLTLGGGVIVCGAVRGLFTL